MKALPSSDVLGKKSTRFANLAVIIEWYDFGLYTVLSAYLYTIFFPHLSSSISSLLILFIYWLGYVGRILGGCIFSRIADTFGRKSTFVMSSLLMTLSTSLLACLPIHHIDSRWLSALFVTIRLLQGIALGIEYPGGMVFIYEHATPGMQFSQLLRSSFFSQLGGLIGVAVGYVLTLLYHHKAIVDFAWRLPYVLAGVSGVILFAIRVCASETPVFLSSREKKYSFSYLSTLKTFYRQFLGFVITIIILEGMVKFLSMGNLYFHANFHIPLRSLFLCSTISYSVVMTTIFILASYMKQPQRVIPMLIILSITLVLGAFLLFMSSSGFLFILVVAMVLLSCTASVYNKFVVCTLCEYSSVKSRVSLIACYNNFTVFIASLFPLLLNDLVSITHQPLLVPEIFIILSIGAAIFTIAKLTRASHMKQSIFG